MARPKHSYLINTVVVRESVIEIFKTQSARYGCRKTHAPRSSATPEQMAKVNARRAKDKLRQTLKANFTANDEHLVLKYNKKSYPGTWKKTNKLFGRFIRDVREELTRLKIEFRYLYVPASLGEKNKRLHHHMVVNGEAVPIIAKMWKYGTVFEKHLFLDFQYSELAEYLYEQEMPEGWSGRKYNKSKNLITPKPDTRKVSGRIWRQEPTCPTGYRFDPDFPLENGVCAVTGYAYQRYGLIKIESSTWKPLSHIKTDGKKSETAMPKRREVNKVVTG